MASTHKPSGGSGSVLENFPTKVLPAPSLRDMPDAPQSFRRVIGPGIIAAGVGLVWAFLLFGVLSVLTFREQIPQLFE